MRKAGLLLGVALAIGLGATATAQADALVEEGRRVAVAADCAACHTNGAEGKPYAGGFGIISPLGAIVATNITPSRTAGIGNYTEEQFARAVREGVRADGSHLYPAMPYPSYAGMTDADVHALYAYFTKGVTPVDDLGPRTQLPFPFNIRASMFFWNLLFLDGGRFTPDPGRSAQWNRGRYLVDVLAHCGACHTPRTFLMAEDGSRHLAGGSLGQWFAPNITADPSSGIGGWSEDELARYLKTGAVHGKGQAGGSMAEAVGQSFQYLPDADLHAIAAYLKTVPGVHDERETRPPFSYGRPAAFEAGLRGAAPSDSTAHPQSGEQLYSGYCASCHQPTGQGTSDQGYPSLLHNTATGRIHPDNLISAILLGVERDAGGGHVLMPRFDDRSFLQPLTDEQIAAISNYVLQNFGNPDVRVTAEDVALIRRGGPPSPLLAVARFAVPVLVAVALLVLGLLLLLLARRRRTA